MESFGEALRRYRETADMSQPHLATLAHWSQSRISRAETGSALPPESVAMRLDAILDAHGDLLGRYRDVAAERQARTEARRALARNASTDGTAEPSESQRRQVLALAGAVAFGGALPQPPAEIIAEADVRVAPPRVELGDVREVERAIADLEDRDHRIGGVPTRHLALGELRWATTLLGACGRPDVQRRLQVAVAYLSDLAAWTTADAGRPQAARKLFLIGLKAAHEAEDPGILSHVATGFARLEIQERQPKAALDLVRLARSGADDLPAPALSMLHVVTALALARVPEPQACRRQLALAEKRFRSPTDDDPAWIGYFTEPKLRGDTCCALYDLARATGKRDEALIGRLEHAVAAYPPSRGRSKAIAAARLAILLFRANELDRANPVAVQATDLAEGIRSMRLAEDLAVLAESAGRYSRDVGAQDVVRGVRRLLGPASPGPTRRRSPP